MKSHAQVWDRIHALEWEVEKAQDEFVRTGTGTALDALHLARAKLHALVWVIEPA